MKNILSLLIIAGLLFLSGINLAQEKTGLGLMSSTIAYTIDEKDLFPEGIAYDPETKQVFVSCLSKEKVIAINQLGQQSDFVKAKQDGMLRSLGMKVDEQRRRLWIVSNSDWGENMVSAIHIYNIDTKKLIKSFFTPQGKDPNFNDCILTKSGGAYISDWRGNSIYHVTDDLSKLELFLKSDSLLQGPNGLDYSSDSSFLYVASHTRGIVMLDLKSKSIQAIGNYLSADTRGIDGLVFYKNSLVAVLNGEREPKDHFIARYYLSPDGKTILSASVIDCANPLFSEPTTAFITGDELYCLAATFLRLFSLEDPVDLTKLNNPLVLKYKLE